MRTWSGRAVYAGNLAALAAGAWSIVYGWTLIGLVTVPLALWNLVELPKIDRARTAAITAAGRS